MNVSDKVFGEHDSGFGAFVDAYPGKPDAMPLRDPRYLWDTDMAHFGASFCAVVANGFPADRSLVGLADFGSLGGDLLSVLGQCVSEGVSESAASTFASKRIGDTGTGTFFGRSDYFSDVDAVVLSQLYLADKGKLLSTLFKGAYEDMFTAQARFQTFLDVRFGGSTATMQAAAESMFDDLIVGALATPIRDAFWLRISAASSP